MAAPLDGLRVIDCSHGLAGPRATGLLADYGASVTWVEAPGGTADRAYLATEYSVFNRSKKSVEIDLKDERDELLGLLEDADVIFQSWRPGVALRLGLDFDALHTQFPHLVYCEISGFGQDGPLRDLPGYEALVHAVIGTMGLQGGFREGPLYESIPFASIGASHLASLGALAALYRRLTDGVGRHVETSILDGALAFLGIRWSDVDKGASGHTPGSVRLVCRPFLCSDGTYLGVHSGAVGAWGRFVRLLGLTDRIAVSANGLDLGLPLTTDEAKILEEEVPAIFAEHPRAWWLQRLIDNDIAAMPVLAPGEIFDEEQTRFNGMVVRVDDSQLGPLDQVAPPMTFSRSPSVFHESVEAEVRPLGSWLPESSRGATPDDRPLLDDLKILDLGSYHAGPFASRMLADFGADVVKLEPVRGDVERGMPQTFRSAQAKKRSLAMDLKHPQTEAIAHRLVAWADVVHHNMRPGAAERLGLGFADVYAINPDAVYLHAPGWGLRGPSALRQSFEPLMSYYVGAATEAAGQFNPPVWPVGIADPGAGLLGAIGIMIGVLYRRRGGPGQLVESPQLNATMTHVAHIVRTADGTVLNAGRLDTLQTGHGALDRLYETADGWLLLNAWNDVEITGVESVLGISILDDSRFADAASRRSADYELSDLIARSLAEGIAADWVQLFAAAGVAARVPEMDEREHFFRDPENQRTGRVAERADPRFGRVREIDMLVRLSHTWRVPHRLAPELGAHTEEILAMVGIAPAEVDQLKKAALIFAP